MGSPELECENHKVIAVDQFWAFEPLVVKMNPPLLGTGGGVFGARGFGERFHLFLCGDGFVGPCGLSARPLVSGCACRTRMAAAHGVRAVPGFTQPSDGDPDS